MAEPKYTGLGDESPEQTLVITNRNRSASRLNQQFPQVVTGNMETSEFIYMKSRPEENSNADQAEILLENHADKILKKMEEDPHLMEDNVESEKRRRETLKHMPQSLYLKRSIKKKLSKSVNRRQTGRSIGFLKRSKYSIILKYSHVNQHAKNLVYTFELWHNSLKTIEGQFGSSTSSYFKFLRWLFLMNISVMLVAIIFIVIPHATFKPFMNATNLEEFSIWDIFTGEGVLTNTLLYYGHYSNESINYYGFNYSMPYAYFYTMLFLYIASFLVLIYSAAVSYRTSFIETKGGLKNVFAQKIFCGWDFGIATVESAALRSKSIYNELKELLCEIDLKQDSISTFKKIQMMFLYLMSNCLILFGFALIGVVLWVLLDMHAHNDIGPILIAFVANFFNIVVPLILTKIASFEMYKNPRNAVGVTLVRSFILSFVIIGTLVAFWMEHSLNEDCWETSLAQEMYRLILFDFLLSILVHAINVIIYFVNRHVRKVSADHEFDVASNTLDLIYSQSLFWMGFFFSPVLSIVVAIKMFLTWYLKQYYVLKVCKPSSKVWKASQIQTWFLTLTFLSHLATGSLLVFIFLKVPTTKCGPFQDHMYFYEVVSSVFKESSFEPFHYLVYLTKPGVITLLIIALCVRIYYMRERANAQIDMVKILKHMQAWQAKDKKFLLEYIAEVTKGEWEYNIQYSRFEDPYLSLPNRNRRNEEIEDIPGDRVNT